MGYRVIIFVFLNLAFFSNASAQSKYFVDSKNIERRVPLKYKLKETRQELKDAHLWRKNKRFKDKKTKKTKKHFYHIQTKKVKKRIKRAEKKSKIYNKGKIPLSVKLKSLIS